MDIISIIGDVFGLMAELLHNLNFLLEIYDAAEAILLGFQHYLVMLGTTVIIPTALVPQMGGGNVRLNNSLLGIEVFSL